MNHSVDIYRPPFDRHRALAPASGAQAPALAEDRLDFTALLTTLRRNLPVFLGVLATIMLAAVLLTLIQHRRYAATSQIVIGFQSNRIVPTTVNPDDSLTPSTSDLVDTEVKILTSRELADRVATVLNLERDPDFNPSLRPPPSGPVAWIRDMLGVRPGASLSPADIRRSIVDRLLNGLQVTRSGDSYAIDITATAPGAADARRIANAFAQQYIQGQVDTKRDDNRIAESFLAQRLDALRGQAHADMQRVQQYRIAHNLLSTSGASLTEQEISAYNQNVASARAQAAEDEARLNTARAQLSHGSRGDDVGEALGSSVVTQLRTRQATVSGRLADLQARYNDTHPDVIRAKSELADINSQIDAEIKRVISNLEARAGVSNQRLASISGSLAGAQGKLAQNNRAMTDLDDLERRAAASQALYESYLNRYKQVSTEDGVERPKARLISLAELPDAPVSPNVKLNLILGLLLGLGGGVAAAFLAEYMFSGITSGHDVEERLGVPYLAGVPALGGKARSGGDPHDSVVQGPRTAFAEAFRMLRASLADRDSGPPQIIMVASALPKEGKTTIATCLARTIAQSGQSALLIDLDRRRARLSRQFVGPCETGLMEVLRGQAPLEQALVPDRATPLTILPLSDTADTSDDLFHGEAFSSLLARLRKDYQFIIIDTAPVLPVAESRLLAGMTDAVVLVARWRHTPCHAIRAALRLLPASRNRIAGVVLSRIDLRKQVRFARGDAASYYRKYQHYYS